MANFILVHGAWHGAWCWQRVCASLLREGHQVHAVTLTGVGDRAHLLSPEITLETHIQDVAAAIECAEWSEVILAVHSYAGMLGTAIADRMPQRLHHLVYVDAVIPAPGEAWSSTHAAQTRATRIAAIEASPTRSIPAPDASIFGLEGADRDWVNRRQTPHPGQPYTASLHFDVQRVARVPRTFVNCTSPTLATIDAMRSRVVDPGFWDGHWQPNARTIELATGHDPMVSAPTALAALLTAACP